MESLKEYLKQNNISTNNWFLNVGLCYLTDLLYYYPNFYSYIFYINNNYYVSDLEFAWVYEDINKTINLNSKIKLDKITTINKGFLIKNNYSNPGHSFGNLTRQIFNIKKNLLPQMTLQ